MRYLKYIIASCLSLTLVAGCPDELNISIEDVAARLNGAIGNIQTRPQTLPSVLVQEGDTILIDASVTIINNPLLDIEVADLPDVTLLGFENDTGWDIFITYYADDEFQGVYVYDGETLLLEYPCLLVVELIGEDDVDPDTGILVDSFDLTGVNFFNPDDFYCGDALILTFDPFFIDGRAEVVDLLR